MVWQRDGVLLDVLSELGAPFERVEAGAYLVALHGERRPSTQVWLLAGAQAVAVEAFVMHVVQNAVPDPLRLHRHLLRRNLGLRDVHYSVDDVVEPLVVSHQARGRDVQWQPSGQSAFGDPDDLAEVVNILLENAARHGDGAPVVLTASADGDHVELRCADSGPGVAREVRSELFTSGVRRSGSTGSGYGLAIAQRLVTDGGGSLALEDSPGPGATFVARLPRTEPGRVPARIA